MQRFIRISAFSALRHFQVESLMLIALTGLSGAGKTTAVEHLEGRGVGTLYYAGSVLRNEVAKRGLPLEPENERIVRGKMREEQGMAVFAELAMPHLVELCATQNVLLDAIYCAEERDCYQSHFGCGLVLLAVNASLAIRSARLEVRADRPMTIDQLARRDDLELTELRIGEVIKLAHHHITNEGSLDEFKKALDLLAGNLS